MDNIKAVFFTAAGDYNDAGMDSLLDLYYDYDSVGNITSILDVTNSSQKQCFGYDALNRLTSAAVGIDDSTCSRDVGNGHYDDESYSYDATTGNLSSKTGMGTYTYDSTHKHAVASTSGGWSYQYDANGNMTRRDPPGSDYYDFVYDAENRIYQAKKNGSVIATFTYDGDGARVKAVQGSSTTIFVGSHYEKTGSTVTKYYLVGGQRVAMRQAGTVYWLVGDHLGSTSVVANQDATVHSRQLYKPWGESRYTYATLPTKYQYTGQYNYAGGSANDFGLYYYVARFYDPQLGRFAQADTVIPEQSQGAQAWDRYAGMNNNPVRFNDPTGHCIGPLALVCTYVAVVIADAAPVIAATVIASMWLTADSTVVPQTPEQMSVAVGTTLALAPLTFPAFTSPSGSSVSSTRPDLYRTGGDEKSPNFALRYPPKLPYQNGKYDLIPDSNGNVGPGGGLSTFSVPKPGKTSWVYPSSVPDPSGIIIKQDNPFEDPTHWLWEPAWDMPLEQFKQFLKDTQQYWEGPFDY